MPAIKIIAISIIAMMLSGCGQLVSERLAISNSATEPNCPITKRLVVLPFADYSYTDNAQVALRRNLAIMENLTDQLVSRGFQLPVQEDLLRYLTEQNIIRVSGKQNQPHIAREIQGSFYSSSMKNELAALISAESGDNSTLAGTTALDQKTLAKIAADFNAGYIMRGRIIAFEFGEENTWNPLKKGVLPVIIGGSSRAVLGVASSESYDILNQMVAGAALGAIVNSNTVDLTSSGLSSSSAALGGAGAGLLASQSRGNEARVKLRLWVQSPESGQVVWTNRIEVKVKPQTVFADTSADSLFNLAIEKAVSALINDFAAKI